MSGYADYIAHLKWKDDSVIPVFSRCIVEDDFQAVYDDIKRLILASSIHGANCLKLVFSVSSYPSNKKGDITRWCDGDQVRYYLEGQANAEGLCSYVIEHSKADGFVLYGNKFDFTLSWDRTNEDKPAHLGAKESNRCLF